MKSSLFLSLSIISLFSYSPNQVLGKTTYEHNQLSQNIQQAQSNQALQLSLTPHDSTMKSLIITQDQKNAVLKNIDKILAKKNQTIFEYMKLTKQLESKLEKMSFKDRIKSEMKKRELSSELEESSDSLASLKGIIVEKDLKIQYLQKLLKNQNTQLASEVKKLNFKLKRLSHRYNTQTSVTETSKVIELESKHHETLRRYQNKLYENQKTISEFNKKFKSNKSFKGLIEENSKLAESLRSTEIEIKIHKAAYDTLEQKYLAKVKENKELEALANAMKDEFNVEMTTLKEKYAQALKLGANKRSGRVPASTSAEVVKANNSIQNTIENSGLGHLIEIDPQHMKLVLDETLIFSRGGTSIDDKAKENIKRILSVYTKEIYSNPKLRNRLLKVQFIGHASPIFKGKFVEPLTATKEAYDLNMDISLARSTKLFKTIFSEDFGDFPNKQELRSKVVISGKSFSEPLEVKRGPAALNTFQCGEFNCEGSQRVEILFEFEKEIK
ncbi:hypothetical protein [Halobacteriovorax sp. HLS]|uniref:hypothetical protein n=1 Tax=Halobacteriovorax sp. HLS TaxID=2234000 RepID=UPI000FDAF656|nr:hypothetical protein [Halobacteriovorax sp. HLS]